MFSTNTIAKLAGINNFVLNEATTSASKYTDEQIIDLFKKVELGIRQNDELFALNKKFFGGVEKTAAETAEEDQKKQEEKDKADKKNAEENAAATYEDLKKEIKGYFSDESLYDIDHKNIRVLSNVNSFDSFMSDRFKSITNKEQSLEIKPFISSWIAIGEEFAFIRNILLKTVKRMANFINSGNGKFKAKDFGDYVNSLLQHQQVKQIVYEKTINDYRSLIEWTNANKDKPIIEVVNENKELIKLIIKKADYFAKKDAPADIDKIDSSTTFIPFTFTIFTRPSDNIRTDGCKFIEALERAHEGQNKIFIWNQGVYSAVSLDDTINLSVILKGLTNKTLKQLSNIALRSFGHVDFSKQTKSQLAKLNESLFDSDLEDDIINEAWSLKARKITVDSLHKAWSEEGRPKTPAAFKEFIEDHLVIQFGEKHSRKISELLSKVLQAPEQAPQPSKDDAKTDTSKPEDDEPLLKPEEEDEEKTSSDGEDGKEETSSDGEDGKDEEEKPQINPLEKFGIKDWKEWDAVKRQVKDLNTKESGSINKWKNIPKRIRQILSNILAQTFEEYQNSNEPRPKHKFESIEDLDRAIITEQQCKLAGIRSPFNSQKFFEDLEKQINLLF